MSACPSICLLRVTTLHSFRIHNPSLLKSIIHAFIAVRNSQFVCLPNRKESILDRDRIASKAQSGRFRLSVSIWSVLRFDNLIGRMQKWQQECRYLCDAQQWQFFSPFVSYLRAQFFPQYTTINLKNPEMSHGK